MTTETDYTEYFEFLEDLKDSGVTNMFGAGPYLQDEYGITKYEANRILTAWMNSYSE